ncbi:MAG: bifunctional diaminohydroxyphosphoribosylaminopyrimidine deaminase/5-amino-6-(5-phosphoribosylamino)uracil reductase RibD [Acidobacteriota bacterium]|nr:bifunctional diaminohydroxyphosphoribosylaminopyrimidine deaminase/5-amino-6-(5-phosphoribosylamino)uracil reductase RibD [Acidobacteriota bacterium]
MKILNYKNLSERTLQRLASESADALFDLFAMKRALRLATRGAGQVSQNSPLVGCLIVCENGNIIGEGFYGADDLKHAEAVALEMAGGRARNSTVYVTLEPHAHFSRTAPCTDALIKAGVRRVVAATIDPNPLVSGRGIEVLRENGIQTEVGLLEQSARALNRSYIEQFATRAEQSGRIALPKTLEINLAN